MCSNDFAVNCIADFEEKQMRLKALRNRQDLFQEEVCSPVSSLFSSIVFIGHFPRPGLPGFVPSVSLNVCRINMVRV